MRVCSPDAADLWVHILFRCTYCDSSDITAKSVMDLTLQLRGCMSWPGVTVGQQRWPCSECVSWPEAADCKILVVLPTC